MSKYPIIRFDTSSTAASALRPIHSFLVQMEAERNPDNRPRSLDYTVQRFQSFPLLTDEKAVIFYAWHGDLVVGEAFIVVGLDDENRHLLSGDIQVLANYRRQGIGRSLLQRVVQTAELENRRLILATTDSAIPAGSEFARSAGGSAALIEETSRMSLDEVTHDLLSSWINAAPTTEFELLTWLGPYPEPFIEAMAELHEVMNTAPKGELDFDDEEVTPQDLRESEAFIAARGFQRWTLVAQHNGTGDLAGFTEVEWHPEDPELLIQGDTVVTPGYRRKGLGRWLKAAMVDLILEHRPQVERIQTETAVSNQEMLRINRAMGFKCYKHTTEWQLSVSQARKYLKSSG